MFIVTLGVVGGSHYTQRGGGSNYLCLPRNPTFESKTSASDERAFMYGGEYQSFLNSRLEPHDAPCAVCQVTRRSMLMIPGRNLCDAGWHTEYTGYLVAEKHSHHRSEFICLDKAAEPSPDSSTHDQNGVLIYGVQVRCGSLKCLPYVERKDMLCAVCTR